MRRHYQVHRRARTSGDQEIWFLSKQLRNRVTSCLQKQRMDYFKDHLTQNKGNPKNFWKTLKLVLPGKRKSSRIEKLVVKNSTLTEPKLIADGPNQYFTGIAKAVLTDSGRENNASVGGNVNIHIHQEKQFQASFVFKSVSNEQAYKTGRRLEPIVFQLKL